MSFGCMKNMKASLLSESPPMQDSEVSDGGEEEVTTSQSSASMQVFAAVRDAFRIKNGSSRPSGLGADGSGRKRSPG